MTINIPASFRKAGFMGIRKGPVPTRFHVLGERSSGTNFVKRILGRNTPLTPTEALGWKHGFPNATAIPADMVVVVCIRDARAWARSMHAKPWHSEAPLQRLEFSDFLRAEWRSTADRDRYFPKDAELGIRGQILQHDRHPMTGLPLENLFALRRAKLWGHLSYLNRGCSIVLCRMEEAIADPADCLRQFRQAMGLPADDTPPAKVVKRLGANFRAAVAERPETPKTFPAEDMEFLRSQLVVKLEAALGYSYD
mgnify:CR=1 FL=1